MWITSPAIPGRFSAWCSVILRHITHCSKIAPPTSLHKYIFTQVPSPSCELQWWQTWSPCISASSVSERVPAPQQGSLGGNRMLSLPHTVSPGIQLACQGLNAVPQTAAVESLLPGIIEHDLIWKQGCRHNSLVRMKSYLSIRGWSPNL